MPVTADKPAPYAPASAILGLIERHRNKGLPSPVDASVLARAGISDSLIPRTLQSLQILDLIDDEGRPSQILEGIRRAPEAEYQQRLSEWLHGAYGDALSFVDPSKDDEGRMRDAFRHYNPVGQQPRMVTLFTGLFTAAGVMPERQRQVVPRKQGNGKQRTPTPVRARARSDNTTGSGAQSLPAAAPTASLHPALAGLLASLPNYGESWTRGQRDKFVATFGAVLDFCFPIEERVRLNPKQEDATEDPDG
jgi:Family of unknown function (DUF5343)